MRTPGPEGGRALLALGGEKYRPQWERLLRENGFSQVEAASSGGEARRLLLAGDWDLLLIAAPLPDEFGHDLATDAAEQGLPVLLSVKAELWEEASARVGPAGVVALGRPFSRAVFAQAVGMLRAAQAQVGKLREENKKLRQKLEELRAVSRAKCLLVEYLRLDEESAHKYIERAAMEERKTRRAVAEEIIAEYGQHGRQLTLLGRLFSVLDRL